MHELPWITIFGDLAMICKLADVHEYDTRNASTQHVYVCFQRTTHGQKTLSYCGARIWNYVLENVDSNSALGLIKKTYPKIVFVYKRWPICMIQHYVDAVMHQ